MPLSRKTGKDLLDAAQKYANLTVEEAASACGYVTEKGKVQKSLYLRRLVEAMGLHASSTEELQSQRPEVSVKANGSATLGATYLKQIGAQTGDRLSVKVGRKTIQISLVSDTEDEDEGASFNLRRSNGSRKLAIA